MTVSDFNDKIVYITGGSAGIGLAAAKEFAARGAHVQLFARREGPLKEAQRALQACARRPEQRFGYAQADVSDPVVLGEAMDRSLREFGTPYVLLSNAGRALPGHFEDIGYEQFDETLKINLYGCWNAAKALVPARKKEGGYIVNVSSIAGIVGVFGFTDYSASKFAVVGFSEALRSELKPHGIGVSVLCPPDTDTPGFAKEKESKPAETKAISAKASVMTAEAVASALIAGMAKGRFLIVPGLDGKLTVLAKRFFPGLVDRLMDREIAKVSRRR